MQAYVWQMQLRHRRGPSAPVSMEALLQETPRPPSDVPAAPEVGGPSLPHPVA